MGGQIDWAGLEIVAELQGEQDIEALICRLAAIRNWKAENRD
jgi:hypothetical protein